MGSGFWLALLFKACSQKIARQVLAVGPDSSAGLPKWASSISSNTHRLGKSGRLISKNFALEKFT